MAPTITHPDEDFSGRVANVNFAGGKADTDNEGALAYFRRHEGFKIGGSQKSSSSSDDASDKPLEDRSVPQLKKYAKDNDINLGGATKKDDILQAIADHQPDGDEDDGDEDDEES